MGARISGIMIAGALVLTPILLIQVSNAAQDTFAPLEAWKAAIVNGDQAALAKLYSANARVSAGADKLPIALHDELAFWADLRPPGTHGIQSPAAGRDHRGR